MKLNQLLVAQLERFQLLLFCSLSNALVVLIEDICRQSFPACRLINWTHHKSHWLFGRSLRVDRCAMLTRVCKETRHI